MKNSPIFFKFSQELYYIMLKQNPVITVCHKSDPVHIQKLKRWPFDGRKTPRTLDNVKINDVVLIAEDKTPQSTWRIGRIVELIKGRDDICRGAKVMTRTENQRNSVLRRPINKLIPLELDNEEEQNNDHEDVIELTFIDDSTVENINWIF